jgi:predicted O-methyltransferase YrrM
MIARKISEIVTSWFSSTRLPYHSPITSDVLVSDFRHIELPGDIPDLPGMISVSEGNYLYWLASELYKGEGSFVEIGTWLGRSTVHLAAGLAKAHPGKQITCYDHFVWSSGANWAKAGTDNRAGSDFMPDFLANVHQYRDIVQPVKAKIADIVLPEGGIEVVVLDAPKRRYDISAILTKLSRRIMPGKTIMVWQDFMHAPSFEIPACLYMIADRFEPVHAVTSGSLVALRVVRDWNKPDVSLSALSFDKWSYEQAVSVWDYWTPMVPDTNKASFRAGLAFLLHDLGMKKEAVDVIAGLVDDERLNLGMKRWGMTSLAMRYEPLFSGFNRK